ncbi:MAG: HAD family hydrolase [Gammaproteobacteria bacterium]|nr:HAD family hydrolase [Gammaproteobacteria bacterium]
MTELRGLLFDVDGTLADTERDGHRVAFNRAFQEAGLVWNWPDALYGELLTITGGKERIRHYIETYLDDFQAPMDLDEFIVGLHQSKTAYYMHLLAGGAIPLRSGVKRLLLEAREVGLRLGIATTTTPENVEALLLNTLGADAVGWFEIIAAGDVVPKKKPAPDIYFYAMEKMGLRPDQCIAFEDSENGIRASHAAGLTSIITVNGYTREHNFADAAIVLDQMGEPDLPFDVLQGDAGDHAYLNIELIKQLHQSRG